MLLDRARLLVAASLLLAGCASADPQDDDDPTAIDDTPHITVVGTATAPTTPDEAEIRLSITTQKPTAAEAWEQTTRTSQAVVEAAKMAGVKPPDIETTAVALTQHFDDLRQPDGSSKREARGFVATYRLAIKTHDLKGLGDLSQSLIDKGANAFDGIAFVRSEPDALRDKIRGDAMRDAHHQAEIVAAAAGVKLGALLQVERPDQPPPNTRPLARTLSALPIEPGTQTLSAEVEATYAIE